MYDSENYKLQLSNDRIGTGYKSGTWFNVFSNNAGFTGLQGKNVQGASKYVGVKKDNDTYSWVSSDYIDNSISSTSVAFYKRVHTHDADIAEITDAGYATFASDSAIDYSKTENLKAYTVTYDDSTQVITLTEAGAVPARTPVVLKGSADTYILYTADNDKPSTPKNDLKVSATNITADGTQWILAKLGNVVGFSKATPNTVISAGKGYLVIEAATGAKDFLPLGGNTTGIDSVKANAAMSSDAPVYNLAGQRVGTSYKGIVIQNGRKYIQK